MLRYTFALDTLLFLTKKKSSLYDIASQSYIKNKINAELSLHPLGNLNQFSSSYSLADTFYKFQTFRTSLKKGF